MKKTTLIILILVMSLSLHTSCNKNETNIDAEIPRCLVDSFSSPSGYFYKDSFNSDGYIISNDDYVSGGGNFNANYFYYNTNNLLDSSRFYNSHYWNGFINEIRTSNYIYNASNKISKINTLITDDIVGARNETYIQEFKYNNSNQLLGIKRILINNFTGDTLLVDNYTNTYSNNKAILSIGSNSLLFTAENIKSYKKEFEYLNIKNNLIIDIYNMPNIIINNNSIYSDLVLSEIFNSEYLISRIIKTNYDVDDQVLSKDTLNFNYTFNEYNKITGIIDESGSPLFSFGYKCP